ncbi:MAG: SpoIID/LytB domain-containing protein [bacterium]|nr:SpoIID/LytB domain-containing protein [bacterium]
MNIAIADDLVRVGITDNNFQNVLKQQVTVYGTSNCDICDKETKKILFRVAPNTDITVTNLLSGMEVNVNNQGAVLRDFVIVCPTGLLGIKELKRKGKPAVYHGAFEFVQENAKRGFYLVNLIELQEYLKGVVPNEMPVKFGLEALKAQAVAARNYVITPRSKTNKEFDVVDSVASQVYFGANTETDLATQAVMETDGIVALYNHEPILTLYSSTAGGYTESYSNAFSDNLTGAFPSIGKPYLTAVPDKDEFEPIDTDIKAREFYSAKIPSYDIESPYYRWQKEWTIGELENVLKQTLVSQSKTGFITPVFRQGEELGNIKDIKVMKRGESGKAMVVDLMTSKGCYRISKELVIRRVFQKDGISLPSANVVFEKKSDNSGNLTNITAYGGGFGHGVGMSQYGAGYMATKLNQPYYNILRHYYKGISLGTKPVEVSNKEVEQVFWAPIGRAHIVIVGPSVPKITAMINGKIQEFNVTRTLFQKEAKIDISRCIEDGQNKVLFYPTYFPMKVYIELVESYNTNTNKSLLGDE